jgi:hypothetical protein
MRKLFTRKLKTILVLAILVCFTGMVGAQTICNNETGSQGGYTYEYWKDNGSGCMVLGSGGTFSIDWNNINNLLARKGLRPGSKNQVVNYSANYQPNGNSYLCVYGWTKSPLVEYYIVDSWGSWRPPGGEGFMGTVNSDGATYDIYRTQRVNQPSIEGTATFYQFWSVRQSKRTSGTISCGNHFDAWASKGMNMGNLYEVSFCVEGYQSSGTANVTSMTMTTGGGPTQQPTPTPPPTPTPAPTLSSGNIMIRARGTMGGERMELRINNNVIASWIMTTSYQNHYANGTGSTLDVYFTNDDQVENGMDIQVDYLQYDGTTYQAEDQETNTGVYQDSSCGGSYSEMLQCDGYIRFNVSSTPQVTPTPVVTGTAGDVNNDGTVNIVDALMTAQYYVGLNPQGFVSARADVNCDGNITVVDALMIAQYYVGLLNSLNC